jgi:DNA-binding response OmpR family regulator
MVYSFDNEVTPNAIEAAVSRLRKRLDAHGASVDIAAMRGLGYILREREHANA